MDYGYGMVILYGDRENDFQAIRTSSFVFSSFLCIRDTDMELGLLVVVVKRHSNA